MALSVALYHFTHVDNLASIVEEGAVICDARVTSGDAACQDVGDHEVKERRRQMPVTCGPRGVVADYVPFYFAPRSPMLYVISHGRVAQYSGGQEPLVYLVTDVDRLLAHDCEIVFSDGNAASRLSNFFDDPNGLDAEIDWPLMQSRYWNNTLSDPDRMRRRMAEALAHREVPWQAFTKCVTMTEAAADIARDELAQVGSNTRVDVVPEWYY